MPKTAVSEIISRITIVPVAVVKVAFPSMVSNREDSDVYKKTYKLLLFFGILALVIGFLCGEWFMRAWLGKAFDTRSVLIMKILLVGVFFNILAQAPYLKIQSRGFSKITAYIHVFECLPYFIVLFYLIKEYGLVGVALAWSLRMIIDFLILSIVSEMKFIKKDFY